MSKNKHWVFKRKCVVSIITWLAVQPGSRSLVSFLWITKSSSLFCWLSSFPHCESLPFLLASFVIWVLFLALPPLLTLDLWCHTQPADVLASLPGICLELLWSVLLFCSLIDSSTLLLGRILVSVLNSSLGQRTIYVPLD